jgi:hypothetical protein
LNSPRFASVIACAPASSINDARFVVNIAHENARLRAAVRPPPSKI